jgi:hypothetical protein
MQNTNKLLKKQKGAISLYVLLAMLFFLMFMIGAYIIVSEKNKSQINTTTQLRSLYTVSDTELVNKYKSKFAKEAKDDDADDDEVDDEVDNEADDEEVDVIPLSNIQEISLIGSGIYFEKNGKIYHFTETSSYQLADDIIIDESYKPDTDEDYMKYIATLKAIKSR